VSDIEFRVENKYLVSDADLAVIAKRLSAVMQQDIHQVDDCYEIRSIYFDDWQNTCLDENAAGTDLRKKFRIRTYAPQLSVLNLEIKEKQQGLTKKTSCKLTEEELHNLLSGTIDLKFGDRPPLNQLLLQMRTRWMRPKVVVVYERTAFVHPTGNVRITFDRNIMVSKNYCSFFEDNVSGLIPVLPTGVHILEVKYDELLPDVIARQLETKKLHQTSFSKYYLGRCAINGNFPLIF